MEYQIVRSARRKSIAIQVRNQQIFVRTPVSISDAYIATLVAKKRRWIEQHLKSQSQNSHLYCNFCDGDSILVAGIFKTLRIQRANKSNVIELASEVTVFIRSNETSLDKEKIKKLLERFLRKKAEDYIPSRVDAFAKSMSTNYREIRIRKYSARWGSCSNQGVLSFNYLLMMTPAWVVDYVIVHELAHRFYLNHSQKFWQKVAEYYPNYQEAKDWFRTHRTPLNWS
ncbi:M48 family metallopeptidase [Thalassotalea fusca]